MLTSTPEFRKWNATVESQMAHWFDSVECHSVQEIQEFFNPYTTPDALPYLTFSLSYSKQEVNKLQVQLDRLVLVRPEINNLAKKWSSSTADAKSEILWKSLEKVVGYPDMKTKRVWASEIRIENLIVNAGCGFLDLVKRAAGGPLGREKLQMMGNQRFERMISLCPSLSDIAKSFFNLGRTYFILQFVFEVVHLLDGKTYTPYFVKSPSSFSQEEAETVKTWIKFAKVIKEDSPGIKQSQPPTPLSCANCEVVESTLEGGKKLKVCKVCKGTGVEVRYCSSECQLEDWKLKGHKAVRGKLGMETPSFTLLRQPPRTAPPPRNDIDPPDNGYVRSHALLAQIQALEENPDAEYVLFLPPRLNLNTLIFFEETELDSSNAKSLRIVRNMAMGNGAPVAVTMLYQCLKPQALVPVKGFVLGAKGLRTQLESEYGVNLETAITSAKQMLYFMGGSANLRV